MRKKALLAMMLALTVILSGCTLIQKDAAVDAATEIIRLGDKVITKGEIQKDVNDQLDYMAYLYSMYGYNFDPTAAENIADAQADVIENYKEQLATEAKIAELKLDELTDEEEQKAADEAEETYQSYLDTVISSNYSDSELTDEEKKQKAEEDLAAMGYTLESLKEEARKDIAEEKLRDEVVRDVKVTDQEIEDEYNSRVTSAKETYIGNAASWTTAANNGETLYYTPAGVRFVKQILIKFTDEDQAKIDEAEAKVTSAESKASAANARIEVAQEILDDEDATEEERTAAEEDLAAAQQELTEAQAEAEAADAEQEEAVNTAFANIDAAADEVIAALDDGADWDTLAEEKNQDPGMQSGITAERGYAVSADMTSFDPAFVEAAMALEKIGDHTGKVKGTSYGYYIIRYVADAVEGELPLDEVRDEIESSLLSNKQNETYNQAVQSWVNEADFKVNTNALK